MRTYDITELVDLNDFITYVPRTFAHERGEPCGCTGCSMLELTKRIARERARAIDAALASWSKPFGSVEGFLAERAVLVTTRMSGTEWKIKVEAVPLNPLPRTGNTIDEDGVSVTVELFVGNRDAKP